jgi:hypothetical protein
VRLKTISIATILPVLLLLTTSPVQAQVFLISGPTTMNAAASTCTTTAGATANCVLIPGTSTAGLVAVQIYGSMSGTVNFEGTVDGTHYVAVLGLPSAGGTMVSSATAAGVWLIPTAGYQQLRARVSALASGTPAITLVRTQAGGPWFSYLSLPSALSVASLTSAGAVSGTTGTFSGAVVSSADVSGISHTVTGANSQAVQILSLSEVTTIAAAASSATTIQIPANAIVLGVTVRVTTVIPTAATFTVTGTTSTTAFNTAAVNVAATTTDAGTNHCPYYNATAQTITFTPNQTPAGNTGRVRVTIFYILVTPPAS